MTVVLGLITSLLFGVGDFLGGFAARRESAFAVTAYSHVIGGVILLVVALAMGGATVLATDVSWGVVAGVSGMIGIVSLYRAMAIGRMSVVAPITAALSGALPAALDIVLGLRIGFIALAGMGVALVAVVLVSIPTEENDGAPGRTSPLSVALAVLAGAGFAGGIVSFAMTAPASGFWPVVTARAVSILLAGGLAFLRRGHLRLDPSALGPTVGVGLADAAANLAIVSAVRLGPLAVASVFASFYPIVVVGLARVVFGERLRPLQWAGASLAVVAVALTALG